MALDTQNLVLFHDYTKGNAYDYSGLGNSGTLTNSEGFVKTKNGWGYLPQATNGSISVPDSSELRVDASTFVIAGDFSGTVGTEMIFDKRSGAAIDYNCYFSSSTTITLRDGVNTRTATFTAAQRENVKVITITKASGASTPKLYFDSVFITNFSGTLQFPQNSQDLYIGNNYTGTAPLYKKMTAFLIYNAEKTAAQVAAIHNEVIKLKTINTGTRPKDSLGTANPNDTGVVSAWNMEKGSSGKVMDVKGVNHGTPVAGAVQFERTPWGEPTARFHTTSTGGISCGTNTSLNFTTETFGGYTWMKHSSIAGTQAVMTRGSYQADGYYFLGSNAGDGTSRLVTNQAAANQTGLGSTAKAAERWYQVGFLAVASDNLYVYQNGADDTSGSTARTNPLTSARTFYLGQYDTTASDFLGSMTSPFIGTFSSQAEYEREIKKEFNRVANKVIYKQDFESAAVTQAARGSGTLPGTDVEVVSGTHKISTDTIVGKTRKVLECATAGVCAIPMPQGNAAYGTWEWYVYKGNTANSLITVFQASDKAASSGSTQNGYYMTFYSDEEMYLGRLSNGVATALQNSSSTYSNTTWYKFSVTRTTEGGFITYINDTQVALASGSQPQTDTTHTTTKYIVFELDAGDKVALIEKRFGVAI